MTWTPSNAEHMIPRERIHGTIRGVDFGPSVFVLARAEAPMLLWLGGHSWSLNGHRRYSESHLTILRDRRRMDGWRNYSAIGSQGGRLTVGRLESVRPAICEAFGGDQWWPGILHAVVTSQTLLIEGGGAEPMPSMSLGREAYEGWRDRNKALTTA